MAALAVAAPLARAATSDGSSGGAGTAAPMSVTAAELDSYLASQGSPMAGQGAAFVASGAVWKMDPRLLVAIAGAESSFGKITCGPFNAWGYGCPNNPFGWSSWADAIDTVTKGLRTNYLGEGRTSVALIQQKYAPSGASNDPNGLNNYWVTNVSRFYRELGGEPDNVDIYGIGGTRPVGVERAATVSADEIAFSETSSAHGLFVAQPGVTRNLVFTLRNDGASTWTAASARVRRVDIESRIATPAYAVLREPSVVPGSIGTFVAPVDVRGISQGGVSTTWRLEGEAGPVGAVIERRISIERPAHAASGYRVEGPTRIGVGQRGIVVVYVRNSGSAIWTRPEGVKLGVRAATGPVLGTDRWDSTDVPASMLEREVAPGDEASFAFDIIPRGVGNATLDLSVFDDDGWFDGVPGRFLVEVS